MIGCSKWTPLCPFCYAKDVSKNDTIFLNGLYKRIDKYKDPHAFDPLGSYYMDGERGRTVKTFNEGGIIIETFA